MFEPLKQNLQIKTYLGTSENAVKSQVFGAMIVFLLLELIHRVYCKRTIAFSNYCEKVRICLLHYLSFSYLCGISGKVKNIQKRLIRHCLTEINFGFRRKLNFNTLIYR